MASNDRLARLLFLVPYVAQRDGVPLHELASKLGVSAAEIQADLDLLCMVGRPPLTPDHLIDIYVEDDIVYVQLDQSLSRPPPLTQEEASALVLGAKLVGQQQTLGEELERVLERIVALLNPVDRDMVRSASKRVGMWQESPASAGLAARLRAAVEEHREVSLDYYSASSDREKQYRLQPLGVITHSGSEYLVALDVGSELHEKLFRLDRMGALEVTDKTFAPPVDFDLEKFRTSRLYFGSAGEFTAAVRFAAPVVPLVAERFAPADARREADGALVAKLSTSSPAFLARWVLPFGLDAEVTAPASARRHLAEFCREAAAAYDKPQV